MPRYAHFNEKGSKSSNSRAQCLQCHGHGFDSQCYVKWFKLYWKIIKLQFSDMHILMGKGISAEHSSRAPRSWVRFPGNIWSDKAYLLMQCMFLVVGSIPNVMQINVKGFKLYWKIIQLYNSQICTFLRKRHSSSAWC